MTEEINYSYDGGLYAELIRNRGRAADRLYSAIPSRRGATLVPEGTQSPHSGR
jgi:hypothetical protein